MASSQQQGANFEQQLLALFKRVLTSDLGCDLLQGSLQSAGTQYGKDIQIKWRDPDTSEYFWHIECKSHRDGTLHQNEVIDKIIEAARAPHCIQVWCLALANIEPSNALDEKLVWANEYLSLPFALEVLSPGRFGIRELFECHADIFSAAYPGVKATTLDAATRDARIRKFSTFLREATDRGRRQSLRSERNWQLVAPSRLRARPNSPTQRTAYLRGLTPTCPWEAIAHNWTVSRPSSESPLIDLVRNASAGFSFSCLIAAGGEGKSTVLKRLAWQFAEQATWTVLWTDLHQVSQPLSLPLDWIHSLPDGANVLLCIDGSHALERLDTAVEAAWDLAQHRKRVYVLLADRGTDWSRSPARLSLLRARKRPDDHRFGLWPLRPGEQKHIAEHLQANGLLYKLSLDEAVVKLNAASVGAGSTVNKPYLLPTLMQLTDPDNRGFEVILESILSDLDQLETRTPIRFLLSAAILHGAGLGLPYKLAERLAGSRDALGQALSMLDAEIQKHLRVTLGTLDSRDDEDFYVHHAVIGDGLIDSAYKSAALHETLLGLCTDIPGLIRPDMDIELRMPDSRFELLDAVPRHIGEELQLYEAEDRFLSSWFSLDRRTFPTVHRLAECRSRWLQKILKEVPINTLLADRLVTNAREAYKQSLEISRNVLRGAEKPAWFANTNLREHEIKTYHGWAVLEGTEAMRVANPDARRAGLLRSTLLSLLSFEPERRHNNAMACGTLALTLINANLNNEAARVVAASIALNNSERIVNNQRRLLQRRNVKVPEGGIELLDGVIGDLCSGVLSKEWSPISLFADRRQHLGNLIELLERSLAWIPNPIRIRSALGELRTEYRA